MKRLTFTLIAIMAMQAGMSQSSGGITADMLSRMRQSASASPSDNALKNALFTADINQLTRNATNISSQDKYFSNYVKSSGITDQKSSGRCWLFTGLNVLRSKMINRYGLGDFKFSQCYSFFYDQLEKSNLFLQSVIDAGRKPMDDKLVEWLFKNPLSDGGQFTGVADIISKYGVVPEEVMPESYAANNTSRMNMLVSYKLRQYGLELRKMISSGKSKTDIAKRKEAYLSDIYHILTLFLGKPPLKFTYTLSDKEGKRISTRTYTPLEFYREYVGSDLKNNYVMMMNDPTRPYYKLYEIDMDRHTYDGENWTYINLPMDTIKAVAIRSIKDSTMMYMSCDVGKFLDKQTGILDSANYDYSSLLGTDFSMSKKERIETFASMSSHAMTLMGVDLGSDGKPQKWEVENSWGADYGYMGHLIMSDAWLDGYLFRLVAEKKYLSPSTLELMKQKPVLLPPWDPMFSPEQ